MAEMAGFDALSVIGWAPARNHISGGRKSHLRKRATATTVGERLGMTPYAVKRITKAFLKGG